MILNPVNFEAVYQQKKQQEQADSKTGQAADAETRH